MQPLPASPEDEARIIPLREAANIAPQSTLEVLAASGRIDADQVAAALAFRRAFLTVLDATHESLGFNEWQDSASSTLLRSEKAAEARQALEEARTYLGVYIYALVLRVCGQGYSISDLFRDRRDRDSHVDMLRIGLAGLAKLKGDSGSGRSVINRPSS